MSKETQQSSRTRPTLKLNSKLERKLVAYTAAAAGLAFPALAHARIVYTATNTNVTDDMYVDINGDGVADFRFAFDGGVHGSALVIHPAVRGNNILCSIVASNCPFAAAAAYGNLIAAGKVFISNTLASTTAFAGGGVLMANAGSYAGIIYFEGPWAGATDRYLGVKFFIHGNIHFGWMRLSVGNWQHGGAIVLTGYAYETLPNTKILAGHESGAPATEVPAAPDLSKYAPTLGLLAHGAHGVAFWRREQK